MSVKQGGTWKEAEVYVKHGGAWKRAELWVKQGGVWKLGAPALTFSPPPGTYTEEQPYSATIVVTCSETATWTYTKSGAGTVSLASGATGTSITFSVEANYDSGSGTYFGRAGTLTLTATVGGVGYNFTLNVSALGD